MIQNQSLVCLVKPDTSSSLQLAKKAHPLSVLQAKNTQSPLLENCVSLKIGSLVFVRLNCSEMQNKIGRKAYILSFPIHLVKAYGKHISIFKAESSILFQTFSRATSFCVYIYFAFSPPKLQTRNSSVTCLGTPSAMLTRSLGSTERDFCPPSIGKLV